MKTIYSICARTGFFFTFLLLAISLMAQNIQVKGLVKDPAGEAIIGASVVVKGTTNGSITDLDGKFSLSDVPSGATITVSYIGYISQEKKASATPMEFILKEDTKTLDEIVKKNQQLRYELTQWRRVHKKVKINDKNGTKECPNCSAENPIDANFCRKCNYGFWDCETIASSLK